MAWISTLSVSCGIGCIHPALGAGSDWDTGTTHHPQRARVTRSLTTVSRCTLCRSLGRGTAASGIRNPKPLCFPECQCLRIVSHHIEFHQLHTELIELRVDRLHHRCTIGPATRFRHYIKAVDAGRFPRFIHCIRDEAHAAPLRNYPVWMPIAPSPGETLTEVGLSPFGIFIYVAMWHQFLPVCIDSLA